MTKKTTTYDTAFNAGDLVMKHGAGYGGPGVVITVFVAWSGIPHYVVEHEISGGTGRFYHIYTRQQIEALT